MRPSSPIDLVDPELRAGIALFPDARLDTDVLPAFRALTSGPAEYGDVPGLVEHRLTLAVEGGNIDIIICRPEGSAKLPAICCIHGGGFVTGSAAKMASTRRASALDLSAVLVFVDYRLAPEYPFPLPLEDCYRALSWMFTDGAAFGIDPQRIAVSGISAGGGLAAAVAILARDRGEVPIIFQHLLCPMLDDRTANELDPHPFVGQFVWTRENNRFGWTAFLGHDPGGDGVSAYAAPARVENMRGLPPAYVAVGALDLFLEEDIDYVRRLTRAGVPAELHVYPGVYHGATAVIEAKVSQAWERDSRNALVRALHGSAATVAT